MQHLQPNTTLQGGKYRIERVLGQGGFGITYVGYNTEFEETVAIKEFFIKGVTQRDNNQTSISVSNDENTSSFLEQKEKFKKEARRLRKLKNEHIVKVHDLFEENGTAYYVMDYIDGESLAERLKRTGKPMSEQDVKKLLPQILDALKEVHKNEMWHLDLKPGNIMVDKQRNAYLIDFGASKQIRANGSMTTSTALCYTPGYAPNEQIGQMYDRFGTWTDIYALGATIYNLLTNKKPPMAIDIEEDEEDAFDFPNTVSDGMRKLVVWMMQPKRKARPQSVDEIINAETPGKKQTERTKTADQILATEPAHMEETSSVQIDLNAQEFPDLSLINDNEQTVLQVSEHNIPQSAMKVGCFIFEDGTYSEKEATNGKKCIGVLFSCYGGIHGQILSAVKPKENKSINGTVLSWHEASLAEWVKIIQNLGHSKVFFESREYRFFSDNVQNLLSRYSINETVYATGKSVSGIAYSVNLKRCNLTPIDNDAPLPYIYVSDF